MTFNEAKFWARTKQGPGDCITWTGGTTGLGYGVARLHGHTRVAHRVAWWIAYGELPPSDKDVDHLCFNKLCVNVDHLEVVTRAENNRRRRRGWTNRPDPAKCRARLHDWTPENLLIRSDGYSTCRICFNDRQRQRYQPKQTGYALTGSSKRPDPTKCAAGLHDWIPENWSKQGRKKDGTPAYVCKPCSNERRRARRREVTHAT